MFGIGGGEIFFILLVVLMLFGSDKVPEMARTFGKFMAQVKNATNDIKHEINRSAEESGIKKEITETFDMDINPMKDMNPLQDIQNEVEKQKEDIENITGPIKRQL
ncbi:twin-arginine translocase TatA/TatE family subunit [Myroides marinus]|uniref:Sec-independent protein secretion pathway component n=1 Tax=Myroides marinus TaxID=703342 RepID=A0A164A7J4_9FLAO|nr:twin-arginine translocase TatA/TatE family subunit [Myroides marinus]KUF45445.1 Sec-independent protein secretion pathway component [Myroides marinus]KZE83090.1 Sec-independent protein secretion pathway component [Myroides marinus]MDM1345493.1 twin-arginine translocase TatA/TatE family subunit [Myroides marinus]MDM1349082.1 twin-arginine translocase TatA/TatE family subunit [Myroides marinus]MDM1352728.1 twin-arginine translocase TatA/TatE family subunit [Myroides marinus]